MTHCFCKNMEPTSKILTNMGLILATAGEHERAVETFIQATNLDQYLAIALVNSSMFLDSSSGSCLCLYVQILPMRRVKLSAPTMGICPEGL